MRRVTSERAARLGVKPSASTAAPTAARVPGETRGPALMARDAVDRETPASRATGTVSSPCTSSVRVSRTRSSRRRTTTIRVIGRRSTTPTRAMAGKANARLL